jgi:hypothetical protein
MTVVWTIVIIVVAVLVLKAKYGSAGLGSATCRHCGAAAAPGRSICPSCGRNRTVINPKKARKR